MQPTKTLVKSATQSVYGPVDMVYDVFFGVFNFVDWMVYNDQSPWQRYWLERNILIQPRYDKDSNEPDHNCFVQVYTL